MYFRGADSRLSFNQVSLYTLPCLTAGGGTIFSKIDSFDFESLQPVHSSKIAQVWNPWNYQRPFRCCKNSNSNSRNVTNIENPHKLLVKHLLSLNDYHTKLIFHRLLPPLYSQWRQNGLFACSQEMASLHSYLFLPPTRNYYLSFPICWYRLCYH